MSEGIAPRPTPQSRVIERVASHRDPLRRVLARGSGSVRRRPPVLELYYEPGDPHSRLCAQLLPRLQERVRTPIVVRLVGQSAVADYPEPERQRAYALADAARIGPARALAFPDDACVPSVAARIAAAAALADRTGDPAAFAAREAELAAELVARGEPPRGLPARRSCARGGTRRSAETPLPSTPSCGAMPGAAPASATTCPRCGSSTATGSGPSTAWTISRRACASTTCSPATRR